MKKNENGSVTALLVVTILFILVMLGTYLTSISSKRKAQLQETKLLQDAYDGDMKNIYEQQLQKKNSANSTYTDVLYIEANGTQSVTGIILPNNYKFSITASLQNEADYNIFDSNLGAPKLGINSNKKLELKSQKDTGSVASESDTSENTVNENITNESGAMTVAEEVNECAITFGQKITITNDNSGTNNIVLIDGAKVLEDIKTEGSTAVSMLNGFKGKIYSISIYENDELKYKLTPCIKNDTKKVRLI